MKRIVSTQYSSGRVMGVEFKPEARGKVFVGVAMVDTKTAQRFEKREGFEVEDLTTDDLADFPDDFPLLAPQKAALAAAGLETLGALAGHDFVGTPVKGVGESTLRTLHDYLTQQGQEPEWEAPKSAKKSGKGSKPDLPEPHEQSGAGKS